MLYESKNNKLLKSTIIGVIFIIIVGSLLHFTYKLSNNNPIVGLFSPINESVWEHLKMAVFASIFYIIFEYKFVKDYAKNYFFAKALASLSTMIVIPILFYIYTSFTGKSILFIDILIYIVGCIIWGIINYKITSSKTIYPNINGLGIILLLIIVLSFFIFTIATLNLPIFKENLNNPNGLLIITNLVNNLNI